MHKTVIKLHYYYKNKTFRWFTKIAFEKESTNTRK